MSLFDPGSPATASTISLTSGKIILWLLNSNRSGGGRRTILVGADRANGKNGNQNLIM
jgi:hypothetical protein